MQDLKKYLLTIAVPTYNRKKYLAELLPELLKQCCELNSKGNNLEVLISDNASTDNTKEYVKKYLSKYTFLKYSQNERNIGGEANFAKSVEIGQGEYIWIIGDDDLIYENAISHVISTICEYSPEVIICNDAKKIISLRYKIARILNNFCSFPKKNRKAQKKTAKIYSSYMRFLRFSAIFDPTMLLAQTWIPGVIYKRNRFDFEIYKKYKHRLYSQMYALSSGLRKDAKIVITYHNILKVRDKRATGSFSKIFKYQFLYLIWLGANYKIFSIWITGTILVIRGIILSFFKKCLKKNKLFYKR